MMDQDKEMAAAPEGAAETAAAASSADGSRPDEDRAEREEHALPTDDPDAPVVADPGGPDEEPGALGEDDDSARATETLENSVERAAQDEQALPTDDPDAPLAEEVAEESDELETTVEPGEPWEQDDQELQSEADPQAPTAEDAAPEEEAVEAGQLLMDVQQPDASEDEATRLALLEAIVYVTDEPLSLESIARAFGQPQAAIKELLDKLVEEYNKPWHGLTVKEVAGGYKMATKPEHHESVRTFVKNLNPPLKLSLAALETLAVIAYKQPITAPEIMEIRGVQGAGVLKTLIDRKLISTAGRKNVVGKPMLYKTTKEFLVQFGLKDLNELPTLREFEDLRRMAFSESDTVETVEPTPAESAPESSDQAPQESQNS